MKSDMETMKNDKQIMSLYIDLLAEKDIEKASKIVKDMDMPMPSDTFDSKVVEAEGWAEEDCINQLIFAAMPEKNKEKKTERGDM